MNATIAQAGEYWDRYYSQKFLPGLGTEEILQALQTLPPARTWLDAGAGSESLLWSIPLQADRLIAADIDADRLSLLRLYATSARPRPAYQAVLNLCERTELDFADRCRSLAATLRADCLTGPLPIADGSVEVLTQMGLLGLARTPQSFLTAWERLHRTVTSNGWYAGANWVPTKPTPGRVHLTAELYQRAFTSIGTTPHLLTRVAISGDPDFTAVWIYAGRTR